MATNRITPFSQTSALLKSTALVVGTPRIRSRTRLQSLGDALRGLRDAWDTQPNLRVHCYAAGGVLALGLWFRLALLEWLWVSFAIGLVIFAELMNTAIEQTIDLAVGLAPDPLARQVKDISAGCVLVAASLSIVIGTLTFLPHLIKG